MRGGWVVWLFSTLALASCRHTPATFSAETTRAGDYLGSLEHGGRTRTYWVHIPSGYDGVHPMPLVLALHAAAGNATNGERLMQWAPKADAEGFLLVSPNGVGASIPILKMGVWNAGACCG